jgi:hypothetical protein
VFKFFVFLRVLSVFLPTSLNILSRYFAPYRVAYVIDRANEIEEYNSAPGELFGRPGLWGVCELEIWADGRRTTVN